jgi:hypothetical protein
MIPSTAALIAPGERVSRYACGGELPSPRRTDNTENPLVFSLTVRPPIVDIEPIGGLSYPPLDASQKEFRGIHAWLGHSGEHDIIRSFEEWTRCRTSNR